MVYAIQQEDKRLNSAIQAWFNAKGREVNPSSSRISTSSTTIKKNLIGFFKKSTYENSRTNEKNGYGW